MLVEKTHATSFIKKVHSCKALVSGTTVSKGAKFSVPMSIFKPTALIQQKGLNHFIYPEVVYRTDKTESELG